VLTGRGWIVAAGAVAVAVVGRMLGIFEMFLLAAGAAVLLVAALVSVRLATVRLDGTRQLHPPRVHCGVDSRVELELVNRGGRGTPVVTIRDPFDRGRRQARFLVPPLRRGEAARAAYRLPTERRGVFPIGPMSATVADPFGLAARTRRIATETELTVYPRVDPIVALPQTIGHDPHAGADHPTAVGLAGEDFYALRAYEVGDDLRKVHWPSTARLDELMIRQEEMPWQGRATVLLDGRAGVHTAESFELAVSAAASLVAASWRRGALVRLVSTGGLDSGFAAGAAHVEALFETLAAIAPSHHDRVGPVLAGLRRTGNAGALAAIVTGAIPTADLDRLARLQVRYGSLTLVVFERSSYQGGTGQLERVPAVGRLIRVTAERPFAAAWNRAMTEPAARVAGFAGWRG